MAADGDTVAKTGTAQGGIDKLCIDTIRTLALDAVQKANSGHPGTPIALTPAAYTLWQDVMRYDPADASWPNRDRFVLSVGHASMLLYAMLNLAGVKKLDGKGPTDQPAVSLDDIKQFRQLSSVTPGHPEFRHTTGVETTTGPLGQGCGNSVGMAIAQRWMAERYNKPGFALFDYKVYVFCSDGDLMEGVSQEAASLAGHLRLPNLLWLYDDNKITIEGETDLAFNDDVGRRFESYGWHVLRVDDANDTGAIGRAYAAMADDRPTMIVLRSVIGYGMPTKAGTHKAHSDAPGVDEIKGAKRFYGWPEDAQFLVPPEVPKAFADKLGARGAKLRDEWQEMFARYKQQYPELARELEMIDRHELPDGWDAEIPDFPADPKGAATRDSGGKVLNAIAQHVPWLMGGSADLSPSTKTNLTFQGAGSFEPGSYGGRNMHFGIREHVMGSVCNGMAIAGMRAYGSTFLIFSDYMKPPIRLSAIMEVPAIWVFTHDSIGVGEDGPTHQPVEQMAGLRAIPGMIVLRPGDANETAEAWRTIMRLKRQPACLVLSRQALPTLDRTKYASAKGVAHGAYVLAGGEGTPDVILMGTGSELSLCVAAYEELTKEGITARVVSMPSWELFEQQDEAYRHSVLPPAVTGRVAVEQASQLGWDRYVGPTGTLIAMHTFGASAPAGDLLKKFGFTPEKVLEAARAQAKRSKGN